MKPAIRKAWGPDTGAEADKWTLSNPAWGQCVVTALVIQDLLGGDLLRSTVNGVSHYWNRLPGGFELDLTFEQFGPDSSYDAPPVVRDRSYVLAFSDTVKRYEKYRNRVTRFLFEEEL